MAWKKVRHVSKESIVTELRGGSPLASAMMDDARHACDTTVERNVVGSYLIVAFETMIT